MSDPVRIHVSVVDGMTQFVVIGTLTVAEVLDVVNKYYPTVAGDLVLWDLSRADVSAISQEDFKAIAAAARSVVPPRDHRKTAYVVADGSSYAKMCRYLNAAVVARVAAEYSVFMDVAAARHWLGKA